jgi:cellulose synthase (UDP-forming)
MSDLGTWLTTGLQAVFALVVLAAAVYVLLEVRILLVSRRTEQMKLRELDRSGTLDADFLPPVTVLLPVRNEAAMVERLIDAACRLRYPPGCLEILVLDDSTDATSELAQRKVEAYAANGIDIRRISREQRTGFKAGNLMHGAQHARGEHLAVFDADFVPPEDFLLRTMPRFKDPGLGFLQTGIGYENIDHSFLTRFQAMEMGHQQYVMVGLDAEGHMALLSGTSCVWRKACVEALGGWDSSTATEDADLCYRAQLERWTYAYLRDVVSMSVLPETPSAFRLQRERWGRGLIHNAIRHLRTLLDQPMPFLRRLHALAMMFAPALLALIYAMFLMTLPLASLDGLQGPAALWTASIYYFFATVWALNNAFAARAGMRAEDRPGILRTLWHSYLYAVMFLPMAWHFFAGGVRGLVGVRADFHRTPKGAGERAERTPPINRFLLAGEALSFVYAAAVIGVAFSKGNYILIPFSAGACLAFGMMLYWSWRERHDRSHT